MNNIDDFVRGLEFPYAPPEALPEGLKFITAGRMRAFAAEAIRQWEASKAASNKPQISLELMQAIVDAGFMLMKMGDKYRLEKAVKITALADKPEPPKETT